MIFYHFTCVEYLDSICREGLTRGDVPLTRWTSANAVWLTTDRNPAGHGVTTGGLLTEFDRAYMTKLTGVEPPHGARFPNKQAVRIAVKIPLSDTSIKAWLPWARRRIAADWLDDLHRVAGRYRTWYLCFRPISPIEFLRIDHLAVAEERLAA